MPFHYSLIMRSESSLFIVFHGNLTSLKRGRLVHILPDHQRIEITASVTIILTASLFNPISGVHVCRCIYPTDSLRVQSLVLHDQELLLSTASSGMGVEFDPFIIGSVLFPFERQHFQLLGLTVTPISISRLVGSQSKDWRILRLMIDPVQEQKRFKSLNDWRARNEKTSQGRRRRPEQQQYN